MTAHAGRAIGLGCAAFLALGVGQVLQAQRPVPVPLVRFIEATQEDERVSSDALREIAAGWKDTYTSMFVDIARPMRAPRRVGQTQTTDDDVRDADGDQRPIRPSLDTAPGLLDRGR